MPEVNFPISQSPLLTTHAKQTSVSLLWLGLYTLHSTISYDDYVQFEGEAGAKAAGKLRLEGKDYVVQDGDVMHFRFNV